MARGDRQEPDGALQLRYLQILGDLGVDQNTTVVFPVPMEMLESLGRALKSAGD